MAKPRTTWSGSISFGLVNIPVGLAKATDRHDVSFSTLHECGSRINQHNECRICNKTVTADECYKGFEVEKGQYVQIDVDALDALAPEAGRTIEVLDFVDVGEIDPLLFENGYYLTPADEKPQRKSYVMFSQALASSGRAAIARYVARSKEYLCVVRSVGGVLVLNNLRYADEIRPTAGVEEMLAGVEVTEAELGLAEMLIDNLSGGFEHGKYVNEHRERILAHCQAVANGSEVTAPAAKPTVAPVDLMAALKASVAETEKARKAAGGKAAAKPRRKKA